MPTHTRLILHICVSTNTLAQCTKVNGAGPSREVKRDHSVCPCAVWHSNREQRYNSNSHSQSPTLRNRRFLGAANMLQGFYRGKSPSMKQAAILNGRGYQDHRREGPGGMQVTHIPLTHICDVKKRHAHLGSARVDTRHNSSTSPHTAHPSVGGGGRSVCAQQRRIFHCNDSPQAIEWTRSAQHTRSGAHSTPARDCSWA